MAKRKSDLEKYFERIAKGKERASAKMLKLACKMLPRIRDGYKRWHFDVDKAKRAVEFIETFCKIPSGRIGQPFTLEPYEKAIVECTFGFVDDDGFRQFHEVLVIIGRQPGQT
ncbi:MAG: hypothetical protein UEP80_07615, partial [Senegalimassilia anaerobia]|nr:hypothetical protein [Senegalimassilia anaerobia]